MNILVVCHYGLYQDLSASFVHNQVKTFAALGHHVRIIIPIAIGKRDWDGARFSGPFHRRYKDGIELFLLRHLSISMYGRGGFNLSWALRSLEKQLENILDGFTPDIIHAHTLGFDSEIGAWLKGRLGVPLVVTTHGSDVSIPVERGRGAELKPFCDHADIVVAVSSVLAGKVRSCGTETPISVILNGFNIHALPEKCEKVKLSFIQVGSLQEQKRPCVTLRAFTALRWAHPEATLCLVGQGPERSRLEALCRELGISGAVRFLGTIPNREVLAEMSKAQFFVLPSVREGFGIVYLEAMASGCITIGTAGEGISSFIRNGENGFLIPSDDPEAIAQVVDWCLKHPRESHNIAIQGRHDALSQTWHKNGEEYINLFEGIRSK